MIARLLIAYLLLFGRSGGVVAQEFIAPGTRLILLSGLPGDLNSETNYREQLQTWLQLAAASSRITEVYMLSDLKDVPSVPGKRVRTYKADRADFTKMVNETGGGTNPVMVVVWGHGGRQGATPVFHVRGPRLTLEDFSKAAGSWSGVESRWLLFFRGSGVFGRELTQSGSGGAERRVLTSDCDSMFTSDPVIHAVFLEQPLAKSNLTFEKLCASVGTKTALWYEERGLARTEEPTLWRQREKPVLLADDSSQQQAPAEAEEDSSRAANALRTREEGEQGNPQGGKAAEAEIPESWKDIKPVDPASYPGADAVKLRERVSFTFGGDPAIRSEHETFIQVLTMEGKEVGDFDVSFTPPYEEVRFLDCEVLSPAGGLSRLDPDAIREVGAQNGGDYQAPRRKVFSLPGVVPGAILHVRYRTEWKTFPLPYISMAIPLNDEFSSVQTVVDVTVPRDAPFHFGFQNLPWVDPKSPATLKEGSKPDAGVRRVPAPDPVLTRTDYGTTYSWAFQDLPAAPSEVLDPPDDEARLMVSLFPDWPAFAGWYSRITRLTDEMTPEIEAKAKELTADAKNDRERVLAVFNFVASLRYVAVPIGVSSFRPHSAKQVLENQFGDCKDKANLFNALLRAVNIDSKLVLVPRFAQAHQQIPGFAFNHAISRVTLGEKTLWVDTTDDVCRFGMLPPGDPGRKVLVVEENSSGLTELPQANPGEHLLRIRGTLAITNLAQPVQAKLTAIGSGFPDYELRTTARQARQTAARMPLLSAKYQPRVGSFALNEQSSDSISDLDHDFSWSAAGAFLGIATRAGTNWVLTSPFWLPREWEMALHDRRGAIYLNQGYPLRIEQELAISLPPGCTVGSLPAPVSQKGGLLQWSSEWRKAESGELIARLDVELRKAEITPPEIGQFQQLLRRLIADTSNGVVLIGSE